MPQQIASSFLLYEPKNEFGLKLNVDNKFWNKITEQNIEKNIKTSDFSKYDQMGLYEKALEQLNLNKTFKFEDDYYPPNLSSLIPSANKNNLYQNWFKLKWVRLSDLYKSQTQLLASPATFTPCDILQGYFGDSHLSNTLSS